MGSHPSPRWLAVVLLLATAVAVDGQQPPPPPRIFHLDLRTLGAVGLLQPAHASGKDIHPSDTPSSVAFLDNSTLVVSFPILNPGTALSTRDKPQGGRYLFHTAVLDLRSGHVTAETSWGAAHLLDRVLAPSPDRFLVRSGDKLVVVSSDWRQKTEYQLPKPAGEEPSPTVMVTAGLKVVFVITRLDPHHERVEALATENLTRLYGFTIESIGLDAASDSHFAYLLPAKKGYALFVLPLVALGKESPPVLQPLYFTQDDRCIHPFFVSEDLLVLAGICDSLRLIAADGTVKAQQSLGGSWGVMPAAMSPGQQRFAVNVLPGGFGPYKTEGTNDPIMVYETSPFNRVSELQLGPFPGGKRPFVSFALSADGSLLAVLQGFDLSVYQLPLPLAGPYSSAAVTQMTGAVPATVSAGPSAQPAAPATTPGAEGGKGSGLPSGTEAHGRTIEVTANLLDLRHDAIEAWVQIANRGTTDLPLDPQKATLEILSPGQKILPALNPDKLAWAIRRVGQVDADYEWTSGCDFLNPYSDCSGVGATADRIRQDAEATAADVRASALRPQTLKPGEQVTGAIFFAYQKKRGESALRLPVGDQVFEFHFSSQKK